jgi:hypothetical protein
MNQINWKEYPDKYFDELKILKYSLKEVAGKNIKAFGEGILTDP